MIKKLVGKNCDLIFRHPFLYLSVLILLTGFFGYYYVTLPTETSVESLIIDDDPDLVFYETFKKQFGEDEILVVGFSAEDVFDPKVLTFIFEQTQRLEGMDGVKDVLSIGNVDDFIGSDYDFIVQPLLEEPPYSELKKEYLRHRALANSLIRDNLLNRSSTAALFLVRPEGRPESPTFDEEFVLRIEEHFRALEPPWPSFDYHIAGWLATDVNLSRAMARDVLTFMPLTYLFLIILVGIALRNLWAVLLAIINVSICLIWTMALLNIIGGSMGPITSILPPLMMALAVSDSIHIFVKFLKQDRSLVSLQECIRKTLCTLAIPCFLTSFTTAIGFLSLTASSVPPIRNLGLAAAGGMLAEFTLSMTIIPLGIYFLHQKRSLKQVSTKETSLLHYRIHHYAANLTRYRTPLLWGVFFLILISLPLAGQIRVETNLLENFKKNSDVYKDSLFIDNQLGGGETFEISLFAEHEGQLLEPESLAIIEKIEQYLEQQPIVSKVTSINVYLKEMNKAFHNDDPDWLKLPESRAMTAQYLLLYDGTDLNNLLDESRQWTRISARITEHSASKVRLYIKNLHIFLDQITYNTGLNARITGKTLIANKLIDLIVSSQIQSLGLAILLIFLVMLRVFRSIKLGFLALIPNVLPILLNFALMGLFNIPLNGATAIIAAVAIGIAVDDTTHFICHYQQQRAIGQPVEEAIQSAIIVKGTPIVITSLILMGGFSIMMFGSFVPTIQFGLLSAFIMLFAVVSDLVVLPTLLFKFDS